MPTLPFRSKKQASSGGFSGGKAREVRKNAELAEEFERRTPRQNEIGQTYPTKDNERHRPGRADWSDLWEDSPNSSGSDVIIKLREKDARWEYLFNDYPAYLKTLLPLLSVRSPAAPPSYSWGIIDQPHLNTGAGFIIGAQSDSPTASYRPSTRGSSDIGLDPHSHIYGDWTSNVSSSGRPAPQYEGRGYHNSDPEFTSGGRQERRSATPEARTQSARRSSVDRTEDLGALRPWSQRPDELETYGNQAPYRLIGYGHAGSRRYR
ncbi:hypothetical protein B0A55_09851 [Friedmanniomyces simplex]|uniref:Uncharacterized protein n=1 Tax=Friedmanniomyces simplex TaxID=329884 RepID=A0A4U0WU32_9PEZI|nr:hypothetical protein B0A55_09851 [Friedmanniomyces simplex]